MERQREKHAITDGSLLLKMTSWSVNAIAFATHRGVSPRQRRLRYDVHTTTSVIEIAIAFVAKSCCARGWPELRGGKHKHCGPPVVTNDAPRVFLYL